jgi:phospholipid/cholesterol/gamma-HCH transport system substrate-binding protein
MEKSSKNSMKLGVFVTLSLVLLTAGIYFVGKKQQLFSTTFRITGVFKDVDGLLVGNNVRFSGITVGIVDDIAQISDTTVRVSMLINEDSRKYMKKNVKAVIGSDGLMGNKILSLWPGPPGPGELQNNDKIETVQAVSMDDILKKIKITADNAAGITNDLAVVMDNIRQGKGTIGKLLMDSVFAENVEGTIVNIKQGAGGFKHNMDAASHNILLRGFLKKDKKKDKE